MQKQVEYSEAIKTKYPEQLVIAIAKDPSGKYNPITLGWTMIVSGKPPMMAIAVANSHHSIQAIEHSKSFTIAYPCSEMGEAVLFFGSKSGSDTDKFSELECATKPAEQIDSVILSDAVANFECVLESKTIAPATIRYM
jgi:flavin reductase (DIM6/NTAB) family NADH-FMN oxidoreductase RutF